MLYFQTPKQINLLFTVDELISHLDYSIDHAFISFTNEVYRQGIGIPMGRNDESHKPIFFYTCMRKPFFGNSKIIFKMER